MERYHEVANELEMTPKQRKMYFQLGAAVDSSKRTSMGFAVDPNYSHEIALWALEATEWHSLKAARAMLTATRNW